jgi:putative membrane protein
MREFTRYGSVMFFGAAITLAGCGKGNAGADSAATATTSDSSAGVMANPTDSTQNAMAGGANAGGANTGTSNLSAANIASLIGLTNASEIEAGKLASTKATNADVKAFAKQMVTDHQAMQKSLDSVTAATNLKPEAPQQLSDEKQRASQQTITTLNSTAKGAEFDKAYITSQVQAHQQALNDLQGFSTTATDPQLKAAINAAIPKVQQHLDKAQQIQSKLSGT